MLGTSAMKIGENQEEAAEKRKSVFMDIFCRKRD